MRRRGAERRESRDETRTLRERSGEATRTRRTTCAPREDVCAQPRVCLNNAACWSSAWVARRAALLGEEENYFASHIG